MLLEALRSMLTTTTTTTSTFLNMSIETVYQNGTAVTNSIIGIANQGIPESAKYMLNMCTYENGAQVTPIVHAMFDQTLTSVGLNKDAAMAMALVAGVGLYAGYRLFCKPSTGDDVTEANDKPTEQKKSTLGRKVTT